MRLAIAEYFVFFLKSAPSTALFAVVRAEERWITASVTSAVTSNMGHYLAAEGLC